MNNQHSTQSRRQLSASFLLSDWRLRLGSRVCHCRARSAMQRTRRWSGLLRCSLAVLLATAAKVAGQEQQDPTTLNGGSILAMAGRECVAVAVDKRFGSGPQMVTLSPRKLLIPHPHLIVGLTGLEGDVQTLYQELDLQVQAKLSRTLGFRMFDDAQTSLTQAVSLSESSDVDRDPATDSDDGNNVLDRQSSISSGNGLTVASVATNEARRRMQIASAVHRISPRAMATLASHVLYNRRNAPYYVEPLIAGLMPSKTDVGKLVPFLCGMDLIGAKSYSNAFVVGGTASRSLYGTAESLWQPNLEPMQLARICGMAFQSALERDCLSGYGTTVYLLTKDQGVLQLDFANRND